MAATGRMDGVKLPVLCDMWGMKNSVILHTCLNSTRTVTFHYWLENAYLSVATCGYRKSSTEITDAGERTGYYG